MLGLVLVGLEAGSVYMYKAGWDVSSGQLVYRSLLAVCLIFVGYFIYHETITMQKIIGIMVCMPGLYLIDRQEDEHEFSRGIPAPGYGY